jgi:hypothetical protein
VHLVRSRLGPLRPAGVPGWLDKYIISDKPMTEEQWTKERATLIDVTPDDTHTLPVEKWK